MLLAGFEGEYSIAKEEDIMIYLMLPPLTWFISARGKDLENKPILLRKNDNFLGG